ncbi:hypothetical protein PPERSA_07708 [Pseudocohnilembus persalinus]|uniref:Uncharacterized protein n=1 Tax=Pseudocohnilembus persalinus TaxID=266149 RepID=A0A0V0R129_PSEPJ|nr:hypothetical protein PPERSA_07708 [Pseudocohnilembus persalinus]|eukprot:KRX08228.1 hypothetical protein PPERSA_07708 [Pseudocohnilembus persalinus]
MILGENYFYQTDQVKDDQEKSTVKGQKKQKVKISRLSQEKMQIPIELDIPINENLVIKERFDWDLSQMNISASEYVNIFCDKFYLDDDIKSKLMDQLLTQLVEHVEKYTKQKKKQFELQEDGDIQKIKKQYLFQQKEDIQNQQSQINYQNNNISTKELTNLDFQKDEEHKEEVRMTSRQKKLELLKKQVPSALSIQGTKSTYYRDKKQCKICQVLNITPTNRCKKCKVPFDISEELNINDQSQMMAAQFYSGIVSFRPIFIDELDENELKIEEFSSSYNLMQLFIEKTYNITILNQQEKQQLIGYIQDVFTHFKNGTWEEEEQKLEQLQTQILLQEKQQRKHQRIIQQEKIQLKKEQQLKEKEKEKLQQKQLKSQARDKYNRSKINDESQTEQSQNLSDEQNIDKSQTLQNQNYDSQGVQENMEDVDGQDDDEEEDKDKDFSIESEELQKFGSNIKKISQKKIGKRGRPKKKPHHLSKSNLGTQVSSSSKIQENQSSKEVSFVRKTRNSNRF